MAHSATDRDGIREWGITHACVALLLFGACGGESEPKRSGGDSGPSSTGIPDAGINLDGLPTCEMLPIPGAVEAEPNWHEEVGCCVDAILTEVPAIAATVLDLSDMQALTRGTCSNYTIDEWPFYQAIELPKSADAYPVRVVLPALAGADPTCGEVCRTDDGSPTRTAFGIALETPLEIVNGHSDKALAVTVSPPWFFVSGGFGEAYPWPCIDGYQEFGVQSCVMIPYGGIGFATADPMAPSVDAVLELIDTQGVVAAEFVPEPCCVYAGSTAP